jgi:hypothetical protein
LPPGNWRGGWRCKWRFFLKRGVQNHNVDTTIPCAPFRGGVVVHRMVFRKSRGRQAIWLHMVAVDEHPDEIDGASGGEFPIGWKMGIVDGDVVRVAFDAEIFGARDNYIRKPVNRFNRGRAHR